LDQVLLDTTQIYYSFLHKTLHIARIERVLMILVAFSSAEFHRRYIQDIHERPSDNVEVPQLMKRVQAINVGLVATFGRMALLRQ